MNIDRLGIPSIKLNDGPHGVRATDSSDIIVTDNQASTCFPTGSALSSSWNPALIGEVASAIGREAKAHGVHLLLGPGINLKRSPLGGRNFEYYSEDPYLTAVLATAFVQSLQAEGVGACLKHFLCNEQEIERMTIDCVVDERAIHEVYAQPFATVIKHAQPAAVMSSYNKLNGEKVSESATLLNSLLRHKLGFEGAIVSDWGAVTDVPGAMQATLDLDMPRMGESQYRGLSEMVAAQSLPIEMLDARVKRILELVFSLAQDGKSNEAINYAQNYQIALRAAEESIVLLKNEANLLPLEDKPRTIGVVGSLFLQPRIQGSGSSKVLAQHVVTPADALAKSKPEIAVDFAAGYPDKDDNDADSLIAEAASVVQRNDTNLLFLGLLDHEETEGMDRMQYALSDVQQQLVEKLLKIDPNLIVILNNGTAVTFRGVERVKTLVEAWLAGSAMGEALVNILFGKVNPSGKLSETFPLRQQDFPLSTTTKSSNGRITYSESILVGHRYYDNRDIPVLFPFGHGLSYTQFSYHDLTLSSSKISSDETIQVSFTIENKGQRAGKEIAQLYVEHVNSNILKPVKTLRKFHKIELEPGESKRVEFTLSPEDFHYFHDGFNRFFVDAGRYNLHIGSSSRDILLTEQIEITYDHETENFLQKQLNENSVGKDFLVTAQSETLFNDAFGHLLGTDLYEIILDMPMNLLYRLFPNLIPREQVNELIEKVQS